ncbi:proteoglycan 4-like [Betta splendens]|uniref:Proteoglycan 4-like n=1 Tax=Betta splendens TaxID=158456 RepID=A0A9W2XSZ9_BETSP|nr:proteoglycan 4-like [Betta splendens]
MSTASSLLLLTLVVNVQLCSPASLPANFAQFPLAAEEPGPEGFEPAETLQEGSAEGAAASPNGAASENEVPDFSGEPVSVGPDDAESRESLLPEFLVSAPHKNVTGDRGFDVSPEDGEADVEEPAQTAPIVPVEASEHGAVVEHSEAVIVLDVPHEPPPETPEEEKSDVLVPVETQGEEVDPDQSKMEDTAPEELPDREPEEIINIDSSNTNEGLQHEEEAFVSVLEDKTADDSGVVSSEQHEEQVEAAAEEAAVQKAALPAATGSVDSSEGDQVLASPPAQEETEAPEEDTQPEARPPFVLADVETNEEEPTPEDPILIVPLADPDPSDLLPPEPALGEHKEPADPVRPSVSASEAASPAPVLGPAQSVPLAPAEVLTGPSAQSTAAPAPASTDADAERAPASVAGVSATDAGFEAAGIVPGDETGAQTNGGAALGAAFFTLLGFILV